MAVEVGSRRETRIRDKHVNTRRSPATEPSGKQRERASTTHAHTHKLCTDSHMCIFLSARILAHDGNRYHVMLNQSKRAGITS
ncbi:jg12748 [Pararge aegeria aegeria]|uniref:Jg12748 protein n=1 Tax=Pararge aegeria aegeria TaxID=348720 RepID=A0A8S4S4H3_9NEOP|nr:jg12748 [Pararge aegeria aegeria]